MSDLSPEERELAKLFKTTRFLIVDPTSGRKSYRALLSQFGVKPQYITMVETFAEGRDSLRQNTPNVIFTDYSLGGSEVFELLKLQQEHLQAGALQVFFLATSQDSNALISNAADETVDGILVRPFTFGTLKERFVQVLNQKLSPTPYQDLLQKGKGAFKEGRLEEALNYYVEAKKLDPAPALASACAGEILRDLGRREEALQSFEEGLKANPTHFRSLLGVIEALTAAGEHERAYEAAQKLVQHHTVPLKRIPELIRLSVLNHKFQDVVKFYELTNTMDTTDEALASYLGAGLVICGLYFLRKRNTQSAIDAFRKAEVASKQKPRILTRILQALISAGLESEMKAFLSRVPPEVKDAPEVRIAQIEYWAKADSPYKALEEALKLVQTGTKDEKLFEICLKLSKQLNRKDSLIDDLEFRATQAFPDMKDFFQSLVK